MPAHWRRFAVWLPDLDQYPGAVQTEARDGRLRPGDGRRITFLIGLLLVNLVLVRVDTLVAVMTTVGVMAVVAAVRWRGPRQLRRVLVVGTAVVMASGLVVGLALPTLARRAAPLIVNVADGDTASAPSPALTSATAAFEVLGYVASDYEDSAAGVDRDVAQVTSLAPTGIALGRSPGTVEIADASDTRVRAHAVGTRALAVVSNFDGSVFNGDRVKELVQRPAARREFISAITKLVAQKGWDGVVLDFENLPATVRHEYPTLIRELADALGGRTVDVAVPAFTRRDDPDLVAYDLKAIGSAADRVTWMAYDQHEVATAPGPIASLRWVNAGLDLALADVPASKLLLGVAAYGYAWSATAHATEYSVSAARKLAERAGASVVWDSATGEWHGRLADHRTLWYSDGRSIAARAQIAIERNLGGIALWRVGSEEPGALAQLPAKARKGSTVAPLSSPAGTPRTIRNVHARGIVALTFDDGPDPKWTTQILAILRRAHVPATFFVIGQNAQDHPGLVREEMRDGDVVGNHTYSHKDLSRIGAFHAGVEILAGAAVIEGITGQKPYLFRSPYGAGDMSSRRLGGDQLANDAGLHAVAWNVDPQDWARPGAPSISRRVAEKIQERSIVLLHDGGGDRSQTVAALPQIISRLKHDQYLFTTVDGLDGSITSPYVTRDDTLAKTRGLLIIAAYRLWIAGRRAFVLILEIVAGLSILRLVWSAPLALLQAQRHRRWRRNLPGQPASGEWPVVSIAVPAHNEAPVIAKTIDALQGLRHPGGPAFLEIIVVDDGSTDGTADRAGAAAAGPIKIRVLSQSSAKKAGALNRAVAEAVGEIVVVIDADTLIDPHFVEAVIPHFLDQGVGAVAGNVKVGNQENLFGRLQALEYVVSLNLDRRAQAATNVMAVVPGAAGAFRRSAVQAAGGYSTDTLVEDADLTVTLLANGWRIPYEPDAIAHTEAPETLRDVVQQRRRWSFGTVEVIAKHHRELLARRAGRIGLLGLPWMLLSQVILPLTGPLPDAFLLYLLVVHNVSEAAGILVVAAACDLVVCAATIKANREPLSMLVWVPLLRLFWRPLQLFSVAASTIRWLGGRPDHWRKVNRYGSVELALVRTVSGT